jgi:hypothetical protein
MTFNLNQKMSTYLNLLAFLMIGSSFNNQVSAQNWLPHNYWTFDGTNALKDSMGRSDLNPAFYNSPYSVPSTNVGNGVGKYLQLNSSSRIVVASNPLDADTGYTVEFLFRPGANINETVQLFSRRDGAMNIRFNFPFFRFTTKCSPVGSTSTISDNWDINLEAVGRGTYGYYVDGNWHHLVFKYDAKNGVKEVWVDGQLPAGFSKTIAPGRVPSNSTSTNNNICDINTITDYYKYAGDLDEIAMYKYALPSTMVYKHYQEFIQKKHYSFANSTITPPAAASISGTLDLNEFAPGHPNSNIEALTQIKSFPAARVVPTTTLFPNTMVFNPAHLAGEGTSNYSTPVLVSRSKEVQKELITNYNYALLVSSNAHQVDEFGDTNTFDGSWIKMGNQNPQWKTSANSYWAQLNPTGIGRSSNDAYIKCGCLPNQSYLRNSSGQFLDRLGNIVSSARIVSPESPLDSIAFDGKTMRFYLDALTKKMTRPLNSLFENGEVVTNWTSAGLQKDPITLAAYNASGLNDWSRYIGKGVKRLTTAYTNEFLSLPALATTRFSHFYLNGHPQYSWNWSETKSINSLVNGQRYSSGDIYLQKPDIWRFWQGAAHGWQFVIESRHQEILQGDKLFSPVVSPGWVDEEQIPRPAQWLGFLKAIGMTGAEYFQTGYFVTKQPYQNPNNYVWQMAIPGYAKGVSTRYEDLIWNGFLMPGDVPADAATNPNQPGYSFFAGDIRKLVVARKHNTLNKYAITGTIQPNSNFVGNSELNGVATIKLDNQTLTFGIRRQGSTYIYDKTNPAAPVFYQVDGWHEEKHPYYWTKTFNIEGELFDNTNVNLEIKTYVPAGTTPGNYTNYTSCVGFKAATSVEYNFVPRGTTPTTHYLWVRARSKNGSTTSMTISLDGTINNSIGCIKDTVWTWFKLDATSSNAIAYSNLSLQNHKLTITAANSNLEIDQITIAPTSSNIYSVFAPACGVTAPFTPTITASGSTSFCQGGSVTLTATSGVSYLWSNGATTRTITVNAAGSYLVTVNNGSQTGSSSATIVSINAAPVNTITASGATTLCPGSSVVLSSGATTGTYLWSNGATTKSITVSTTGNYSVTVTGTNGCTSISSIASVTAISAATATISASGSTTICQGRFVTLSANTGASYLWSTGATTQSINATTAGSYSVTVSQAGGCSKTSAPTTVIVNALPSNTITNSGPTSFCAGGSVTLTSSATGVSYLWSNGSTSRSIVVSTSGNYLCTATNSSGCSSISGSITVTASGGSSTPATIQASGATTFCAGGSVSLAASAGTSYLWSNGATTSSINVTSSGNYSVRITQSGGCSSTSSATNVTVNPRATFICTPSGSLNFCQGGSVTFNITQSNGQAYVWYKNNVVINNASNPSYTANSAGQYKVRVQLNTCGAFSNAYTVTIPCREGETIAKTGLIAYPNPFNSQIVLGYSLAEAAPVSIKIYDMSGKLVDILQDNAWIEAGDSNLEYDASELTQGIYLVEIQTGNSVERIKISCIK